MLRTNCRTTKNTVTCLQNPLRKVNYHQNGKIANVTPIFKAGNRKQAEKYRPISVTSICCRTMERLIKDEIVNHLEHNQIISKNRHGFRKGYSC